MSNEPLTYLEIKRREAQEQYLAEQSYLKKNDAEIKRMAEEDQKVRLAHTRLVVGARHRFLSLRIRHRRACVMQPLPS